MWEKLDSLLGAPGEPQEHMRDDDEQEQDELGLLQGEGEVSQARVTVFGKSYCSFSEAAIGAIQDAGIPLQVIQCDKEVLGLEMQAAIGLVTGHTTSPQVFVAGEVCCLLFDVDASMVGKCEGRASGGDCARGLRKEQDVRCYGVGQEVRRRHLS